MIQMNSELLSRMGGKHTIPIIRKVGYYNY